MAVAVAMGAFFAIAVGGFGVRPPSLAASEMTAPTRSAAAVATPHAAAGVTLIATLLGPAPKYSSPGTRVRGVVPATWFGRPTVLPVIATRRGWVRVRIAQRPNRSTAWLPAADVMLASTPYRIVIDLATTHLSLYDRGRRVLTTPAGVGAVNDPTPTGHFFVAFVEPPPQPGLGYGPFVLVTSAHSPRISNWEGTGDAVIGIHGPLGAGRQIGTTGARISHGCIRLHLQALERLANVPAGTPIDVIG